MGTAREDIMRRKNMWQEVLNAIPLIVASASPFRGVFTRQHFCSSGRAKIPGSWIWFNADYSHFFMVIETLMSRSFLVTPKR